MQKNSNLQFTKNELQRLLEDLDRLNNAPIMPMSDEEVAALEAAYESRPIDSVRDARQREEFEQLRQEWLACAHQSRVLLVSHGHPDYTVPDNDANNASRLAGGCGCK